MPTSTLTYRYGVKDSVTGKHFQTMALAVPTVWNDCSEVCLQAWPRHRRWLRGFDLITLTAGSSKLLGLHSDTLAEGCRSYATRAVRRFAPGVSSGIVASGRLVGCRLRSGVVGLPVRQFFFLGRRYRFWLSRPLDGKPKTGSLTQDAHGHGYLNLCCETDAQKIEVQPSNPNDAEIGIDLGLKDQVTCSDGVA